MEGKVKGEVESVAISPAYLTIPGVGRLLGFDRRSRAARENSVAKYANSRWIVTLLHYWVG
jgi:hypothetical protein